MKAISIIGLFLVVVGLFLVPSTAFAEEDRLSIVAVTDGNNGVSNGWDVLFSDGGTTFIPQSTATATNGCGGGPALGPVQKFDDSRLCAPVLGCGLGKVTFTDAKGHTFSGL